MFSKDFFKGITGEAKLSRLAVILLCITIVVMYGINKYTDAQKSRLPEQIMFLDNYGNALNLKRITLGIEDIKSEAKNHIEKYIRLIYENDQYSYSKNIDRSLNLVTNEVGFSVKDEQITNNVLDKMIKNNARSTIDVDSITIDNELKGTIVFTQSVITNEGSLNDLIRKNRKTIEFKISRTGLARTDENPHAMLITYFNLLNVEKIKQ